MGAMQRYSTNKYSVIDLHKEIEFFDRKIGYCKNYEKFDTESERVTALASLQKKRSQLVKVAQNLAEQGADSDPAILARSLTVENGKVVEKAS